MIQKSLAIYWQVMRPRKWLWLFSFLMSTLFFIGNNVLMPFLISRFVANLADLEGKSLNDFTQFIWILIGLHVVQTIIGRFGFYSWMYLISKTLKDIDMMSFKATLTHGSEFFSNNFTGSLVTKFNRFTRSFDTIAMATMFDLNALLVSFLFPFGVLLVISPTIAFILLGWTVLFASSLIYLHKRKLPRARRVAEYDSKVTGAFADVITNSLSVKMFARFQSEFSSFDRLGSKRVAARFRNSMFGDYIRVYKVMLIVILESLVFYFSAKFALEGQISLANVLLIQLYIGLLINGLWEFGKLVEKLEEALADSTEMAQIYNQEIDVKDVDQPKKLRNIKGLIKLENVDFTYPGVNEQAVFINLSLTIPIGQKVGLVGPSGGGKTTFTKLLLRFMDVSGGKILIDSQNISQVTQDDLRRHIAYVPQEPLLFHRSIYDNIAYGEPNVSQEEVFKAARLAHADEFINRLPSKYQTLVGERGVKLSGGQKQRVAIARAMLKKAPILLLDEATSALDSKSEKYITAALDNLMKGRTTIVIAHRLSTIRKLDRVLVLSNGRIVEDGTHQQLVKAGQLYAELWSHQQGDFLDEELASQ